MVNFALPASRTGIAMIANRLRCACVLLFAWCATALAHAQTGAIVDHTYVAEAAKRGAIIWDTRSQAEYRQGHIPGAINIGDPNVVLRNANTEDFIPQAQIEKILGEAGIDPQAEIVIYSARAATCAYFAHYAVQYFGGTRSKVYHDGMDGWRAAGQPVSVTGHARPAMALKLTPRAANSISTADVVARLKKPDVQLIDVRTPREFSGDDIRAIRGGHIPGAINIPYEQNWVDPDAALKLSRRQVTDTAGMSLKPRESLKALYANLDPNKETVVYCQSGVRAAETATVLAELGFKNVKVYDSSWLGYGNSLELPANNAVFLNVGALNSRIGAIQNRIEALEKELAAARAK
jgi:thiosulfate/3-mercaptopyruvate sulfurtransferase